MHTKTIQKDCPVKEKLVKGQSTITFSSTKCNTNKPEAKKSKFDLHLDKSDYICINCNEVFKDSDDLIFHTDQQLLFVNCLLSSNIFQFTIANSKFISFY